jgi:hypothetical protein
MKNSTSLLGAGVAACALLFGACSSNSACGDADCTDGSISNPDTGSGSDSGVFLSRGMNTYTVTGVSVGTDGCMIDPNSFVNAMVPVNFDLATQTLTVGNQQGLPVMASLGSGVVGTTGTLTRDNKVTDSMTSTCVWHQTDMSTFTLVGGDIFTLDVTEVEDMFTAACGTTTPPITPSGGMCTTTYTMTLAKAP